MLATQVGAGLYMIVRDRLVATVANVQSIKCPICLSDNIVTPLAWQQATILGGSEPVGIEAAVFSGAGNTQY